MLGMYELIKKVDGDKVLCKKYSKNLHRYPYEVLDLVFKDRLDTLPPYEKRGLYQFVISVVVDVLEYPSKYENLYVQDYWKPLERAIDEMHERIQREMISRRISESHTTVLPSPVIGDQWFELTLNDLPEEDQQKVIRQAIGYLSSNGYVVTPTDTDQKSGELRETEESAIRSQASGTPEEGSETTGKLCPMCMSNLQYFGGYPIEDGIEENWDDTEEPTDCESIEWEDFTEGIITVLNMLQVSIINDAANFEIYRFEHYNRYYEVDILRVGKAVEQLAKELEEKVSEYTRPDASVFNNQPSCQIGDDTERPTAEEEEELYNRVRYMYLYMTTNMTNLLWVVVILQITLTIFTSILLLMR